MTYRLTVVFVIILSLGLVCGAQETTGGIIGRVTSGDGQPLPGASVILENQNSGYNRTVVADGSGSYRFIALQPATYEMTAHLSGFRSYHRTVRIPLGSTLTNNIELSLGSFSDVIEVTDEVPLVDMTSAVSGITLDTDELSSQVPITRDVTRVSLLAPGTMPGDASFENDSNESAWGSSSRARINTPGQSLVSFGGASVNENAYLVNGLNITSLREMMGSSFVPMEFVEEAQVKTGGYEAEYGRSTGGVVNLITKSGTNVLRGSASLYWSPEDLQENSPNAFERTYEDELVVSHHNESEMRDSLEANVSLGGPILQDKLFAFAFVRYNDMENLIVWDDVAEYQESSQPYWGGKIDWNINTDHRIEGTYITDEVEIDATAYDFDPESLTLGDFTSEGVRRRGGSNYIVKYSGVLSDSFLISSQYGSNAFDRTNLPAGAEDCPYSYDRRSGRRRRVGCWLDRTVGTDKDEREAYRVDIDWYVGHHSLRAGLDFESNQSTRIQNYSGGIRYDYYVNGDRYEDLDPETELARVRTRVEEGTYEASSNAAYVQDSWVVSPNVTLNLGVRWEAYENKNALGETFIEVNDQLAPRIGVVWDIKGNGRSKLYGSAGIYHSPMSTEASLHLGSGRFSDEAWYILEGGVNEDGTPVSLGEELAYRITDDGEVSDPREATDAAFDPMSQQEIIIGFEQLIGSNWTVGIRGAARQFNEVIEDILIDKAMWEIYGVPCFDPAILDTDDSCAHDYRLTNPGTDFSGWYDIDGDGVLDPIYLPAEVIGVPEADRNYYSIDVTFRRRFADNWMLQGSYTWSHSYGNYEGMVTSDFSQVNPYFTKTFDVAALSEFSRGDLPNDRRHNIKVFGMYAFDSGIQVGGNFWFRTGRPINGFGMHPTDPWAQWYDNKAFYNDGEPCPRGCGGTMDSTWSLDVNLRYNFRVWNADWNVRLDVFNAFDNDTITDLDEEAEDTSYLPNPSYLMGQYFQSPRSVRIGFGVSF